MPFTVSVSAVMSTERTCSCAPSTSGQSVGTGTTTSVCLSSPTTTSATGNMVSLLPAHSYTFPPSRARLSPCFMSQSVIVVGSVSFDSGVQWPTLWGFLARTDPSSLHWSQDRWSGSETWRTASHGPRLRVFLLILSVTGLAGPVWIIYRSRWYNQNITPGSQLAGWCRCLFNRTMWTF